MSCSLKHIWLMRFLTSQLRDLVGACINAEPARRPDISYVYGVARDMHARNQVTGSAMSMAHDHQQAMFRHHE